MMREFFGIPASLLFPQGPIVDMSFPKVSGHGLRDFRGTRKYDFMVVADEVGR